MPHNGVINLLKPPGMTSHDAVAHVRRLLRTRRVGHTGTLDPGAAGVLPIVVGKATRLAKWLQDADKQYRAEMTLGVETDTLDAAGNTVNVHTDFSIAPSQLVDHMQMQLGHILQTPPMVSSVKIDGKRLYEIARKGETVERPARSVRIDSIDIVKIWPEHSIDLHFGTRVLFDVKCSKGTYIRSLCADLGRLLGCGAHMSFLVRTAAGPYDIQDAITLEELQNAVENGRIESILHPPHSAVQWMPQVTLPNTLAERLRHGQRIPATEDHINAQDERSSIFIALEHGFDHTVRVHDSTGKFIALAQPKKTEKHDVVWQPITVLYAPGED